MGLSFKQHMVGVQGFAAGTSASELGVIVSDEAGADPTPVNKLEQILSRHEWQRMRPHE